MSNLRFDVVGSVGGREILDNGFLRSPAYLSRAGVFEYRRADGSVRRELRPPEEVFSPESLKSFQMVPLTDDHPLVGRLDAENIKSAATIGHVGEDIARDGHFVRARLMVTDATAVQRILSGEKSELSCGYTCDVDDTPGTWQGQSYDCVQKNIRGNHVALVAKGRAGPDVRVRLDNCDSIAVGTESVTEVAPMIKIKLDGVDYEVSEAAAQAFEKVRAAAVAEASSAKTAAEQAAARADGLAEKLEKASADLKAATDPAFIQATVKSRVALEKRASEILGDEVKLDTLTDSEIKIAVIKKVAPKADLDGKSADYINARYDGALEAVDEKPAEALATVRAASVPAPRADSAQAPNAEASRKAMLQSFEDMWKTPLSATKK